MKVIDTEKSERGPQRRKSPDGRPLHCCCICGMLDVWREGWSTYCSERDIDDGVAIPKFCSDPCRKQGGPKASKVTKTMKETAKAAELRDPEQVYREATAQEKYRAAVDSQSWRKR